MDCHHIITASISTLSAAPSLLHRLLDSLPSLALLTSRLVKSPQPPSLAAIPQTSTLLHAPAEKYLHVTIRHSDNPITSISHTAHLSAT